LLAMKTWIILPFQIVWVIFFDVFGQWNDFFERHSTKRAIIGSFH
jgi:hypothetical protein